MDVAIICTTTCVLALCVLVMWLSVNARQERKELYDRLQAGTLGDYVANENERIVQNDQSVIGSGNTVPTPDADMDYSFDSNAFDEQTMIDLQQLEENFTAAMMAGDAVAKSEDIQNG